MRHHGSPPSCALALTLSPRARTPIEEKSNFRINPVIAPRPAAGRLFPGGLQQPFTKVRKVLATGTRRGRDAGDLILAKAVGKIDVFALDALLQVMGPAGPHHRTRGVVRVLAHHHGNAPRYQFDERADRVDADSLDEALQDFLVQGIPALNELADCRCRIESRRVRAIGDEIVIYPATTTMSAAKTVLRRPFADDSLWAAEAPSTEPAIPPAMKLAASGQSSRSDAA